MINKTDFINAMTDEQKALLGDRIDGIYEDFIHSNPSSLTLQEYLDERVEVAHAMEKMSALLEKPEVNVVFKRLKNK